MHKKMLVVLIFAMGSAAHAALTDIGGGMIYDDVNNLTWLQDANYAKTSGYNTDGRMTWDEATAWAENLHYGGKDDWRLPALIDIGNNGCDNTPVTVAVSGTDCGYNPDPSLSELAYLYAVNLGNRSTDYNAAFNSGPFLNLQHNAEAYWTGTPYAPDTDKAWIFFLNRGLQVWGSKHFRFHALAVRTGKVETAISGYSVQALPPLTPRGVARKDYYSGFDGLLNDNGQVAEVMQDEAQHTAVWSNGTLADIGITGYPVDINNLGQVAITAGVDMAYPEAGTCYLWTNPRNDNAGATLINLGSLGGGCWTTAMNAAGQVTGMTIAFDSKGVYRGVSVFLWSNGTMTNLDTYENGAYSEGECGLLYDSCPSAVQDQAVDINDHGQVLFLRHNIASKRVPNPPAPGPVVWSKGVITLLPQSVGFRKGKSINNRGDVLGYFNDRSFLIWNVNDGTSYQYDSDYSLYFDNPFLGGAKLTNLGEVYFPRADGIYKLTQDRNVQQVVSLGSLVCTVNQLAAVNDQGQIVGDCDGDSYVSQQGIATRLSSLVPPEAAENLGRVFSLNKAGQILTSTALLTPLYQTPAASCDANQDGKITMADLSLIYAAKNTAKPAYDIDGDGHVTVRDLRKCVLQCTYAGCNF